MSETVKSIHEFDFSLICEYFAGLERQGPGSPEVTARALSFVGPLPRDARIADLGCGTGGQTRTLARLAPGTLVGLDLFPLFIDLFNAKAAVEGLQERVQGVVGSMAELPFEKGSLDLIWSEGAIYNIGFKRGLNEWRDYLKPGGYLAVSESSWFTRERPDEIRRFWEEEYPAIDTVPNQLALLHEAGYVPVAAFILPETCWAEHFFAPQAAAQKAFLAKHAGNPAAEELVANMRREARLYDAYHAYYGYTFFIGKKV